ncbi:MULTISPECIES: hypothetical protein [unclassified Bradyrhizobium]|uniref:hypothetical protein n=1 Tax=unclassified Bradyrhizobium TaxID=2631580 RepID=UPI001FFA5761|nr:MULTISPECIES: hypothetical protein [unclassified Bradyrhizobium]MCK1538677.1 hypothetical protein [Bradyrhizobium sp. 176]MCK1558619.1 hypothetical protein [Bradyrhizobium sp. 171]MCK1689580.1 hypothetical protein [Bradyrhizobium sp. 145]
MEGITSAEGIVKHEPEKVIVSVFLLTGYDHSAAEWLQKAWRQIHLDSGESWWLLVPTKNPQSEGQPVDIDEELSAELREMYGVTEEQTPCMVFDNFIEEAQQNVLSLKGDETLRKNMMLKMSRLIKDEVDKLGDKPRSDRWRRQVTGRVFNSAQWERAEIKLLHVAKKAASVLVEKGSGIVLGIPS